VSPSLEARLFRWRINLFPAYRGTGGRVTYVSPDFREIRIKLPLNWRTRNLVGTTFGGSLYGAVDPFYMMILIRALGPEYTVWDKAASVRFRRPGRATLFARCVVTDEEVETIESLLRSEPKIDRVYEIELVDADGVVHAVVKKVIHVRRRAMDLKPTRTGTRRAPSNES